MPYFEKRNSVNIDCFIYRKTYDMKSYLVLVVILVSPDVWTHVQGQSKINITFGGIFDIETKSPHDSSANMIPAVRMAISHVNDHPEVLTGYQLNIDIKDVRVSWKVVPLTLLKIKRYFNF